MWNQMAGWGGGDIYIMRNFRIINHHLILIFDRLCGLVVRIPGYRSIGPGSIPDATRFSEK
jgi:hypothetical protein